MLWGSFKHENQNLSFGSQVSPQNGKPLCLTCGPRKLGTSRQDELLTKAASARGLGSSGFISRVQD